MGAKRASGGYQVFEPVASEHQAVISLPAAGAEFATGALHRQIGGDTIATAETMQPYDNPVIAALTSGGDVNHFGVNRGIADSKLNNNYLDKAQRDDAEKILAALRGCGAGPLMSSSERSACSDAQGKLQKLQLASASNTVSMLGICRNNPNSPDCAEAQKEAADYLEWSSGMFNSRDAYFDVSAEQIADVDWGGNLDALALDVYGQGLTGQTAYDEITDRAVLYDGRMNVAVGVGTVAVSTVTCIGSAGVGCAIAVGGTAFSELNNIYDGTATLYTRSEQKGFIQHLLETGDLSPEQAKLWEDRVELGLSMVSFGADGVVTLRNISKSGQALDEVFDYGKTDINPLEIREAVEAPNKTLTKIEASGAGLPDLPNGYHYRHVNGEVQIVRNPRQAGNLPQIHLEGGNLVPGPKPGIVRSTATRSAFLRDLANNDKILSNIRPWLQKGEVPPGYAVHHRKALFDGGTDTVDNMVLQGVDLHKITHRFYRPGGQVPSITPPPTNPY